MAPFGPRLGALGPVLPANTDLVRLALLVYAADRSTPRATGGTNWSQRDFTLTIPVSDEPTWTSVAADMGDLLNFLTGDKWVLSFRSARPAKEPVATAREIANPRRVVLLSGGADSALGALESRRTLDSVEGHILVSHVGASAIAPVQRNVADQIVHISPGPAQTHQQIHLIRRGQQVDGSSFRNEYSTRSRSLLFLALGLAVSSIYKVPLWMPENGFASLNPPLAPSRRGSLSTRTTHPAFLMGLSEILVAVGGQAEIENPFARHTKGEIFRNAASTFGETAMSEFLSTTHSCGLTGQRAVGLSTAMHCGECFGCVVRRASFRTAGLTDRTVYASDVDDERVRAWLAPRSVLRDMQLFTRRGVTASDLAALSLPPDYPMPEARDLCDRAVVELRDYVT